jgi:hypothetical protein
MIKIRNFIRLERKSEIPTDLYVINKHSTMGRLVKKMFKKGHIGHQHFVTEAYIDNLESEDQELDRLILEQIEAMQREYKEPVKVLVGGRTFKDFRHLVYNTHGLWQAQVGYAIRNPVQPNRCYQHIKLMGLPATIVPTMDGVLVLDQEMIEVFRDS